MFELRFRERIAAMCSATTLALGGLVLSAQPLGESLEQKGEVTVGPGAPGMGPVVAKDQLDVKDTTTTSFPASTIATLVTSITTTIATSSTAKRPASSSVPVATTTRPAPSPQASVPSAPGASLGTFESTCYIEEGTTRSGDAAGPGSISVDPSVIPLGTKLEVEGYGPGVANDTGSAVKGRIVDVWISDISQCRQWGRRVVEVWLSAT